MTIKIPIMIYYNLWTLSTHGRQSCCSFGCFAIKSKKNNNEYFWMYDGYWLEICYDLKVAKTKLTHLSTLDWNFWEIFFFQVLTLRIGGCNGQKQQDDRQARHPVSLLVSSLWALNPLTWQSWTPTRETWSRPPHSLLEGRNYHKFLLTSDITMSLKTGSTSQTSRSQALHTYI